MRKQMKGLGCVLLSVGVLFSNVPGVHSGTNAHAASMGVNAWDEDEWEEEESDDLIKDDDDEWDSEDWDNEEDDDVDDERIPFSKCTVQIEKNVYSYTGAKITPAVTVTGPKKKTVEDTGENGNTSDGENTGENEGTGESETTGESSLETGTLTEGTDFTVSYENNKNYGVGRVIIQGIGDYTGYHIEKFGIVPGQVKGVKVQSPFYLENTVTWKKVKGADGYYIYRKAPGGDYQFICNVTDGNYQVFHDTVGVQNGKKYAYRVTAYVEDAYYDEETTAGEGTYVKPESPEEEDYVFEVNSMDYYSVKNSANYYEKKANYELYSPYEYSCVKGKCTSAFESEKYGSASGKVTKAMTKKRYPVYTGLAVVDYMAYLTNQKIIKSSMGDEKRIKAVYDWMVKNCTFTKDVKDESKLKKMKQYYKYETKAFQTKANNFEKKVQKQIYTGKALCTGMGFNNSYRGITALSYRKGSCSFLTPMFNVLCRQAGVEAHGIDGDYVNKDKSRDYHNWSFARIGKTYYWYDVAVAAKNKNAKSVWYKKGTKFWKTCHAWKSSETKGFDTATFAK